METQPANPISGAPGPNWPILGRYAAAGGAYIALGFFAKEVFAWWVYGAGFAVLTVWGVPAAWRRLR